MLAEFDALVNPGRTVTESTVNHGITGSALVGEGMSPMARVTKKLDILVVTDPHSMSSKTKTVRRYGTRIIAVDAFLVAIGFSVD